MNSQTAEESFDKYVSALGKNVVQFVSVSCSGYFSDEYVLLHNCMCCNTFQHEYEATEQPKRLWPYIVKVGDTGQTMIRFRDYEWLEMDNLGEALGYLILIVLCFDLPLNRPQSMFLFESLFLGYDQPRASGSLVQLRLTPICKEQGKSVIST